MVIAVTGAAGNVGPFVVAELTEHGHEVIAVDLREPTESARHLPQRRRRVGRRR